MNNKTAIKNTVRNNLKLLKYVWKYAPELVVWKIITVILNVIVDATMNVMFLQAVVDAITEGAGMGIVMKFIVITTVIMLFHDFSSAIYSQYIEPVSKQKIHKGMHNMLFEKINGLDLEKFDDSEFYNDYVWALKEVDNRTLKSFIMLSEFFKAVLSSIVFVFISIQFNWKFLGFIVLPVFIRMAMSNYKSRLNYELCNELNPVNRKKDYARRTFYLKDYAKEMRVYPVGKILINMFNDCVDENIGIIKKYRNRFVVTTNLETSTYWLFGKLPITIYMCYLIIVCHSLSVGAFVAMYSAASKLMYSLASIFVIIPAVRENGLFSEKIVRLLNAEDHIEDADTGIEFNEEVKSIVLQNVNFKYPFGKNNIINNINIEIKKGEKIAFVGLNGAGKSTLIKLLLRFYDTNSGKIKVNGTDIKDYKIRDYRDKFAVIFQDFQIYAMPVMKNITMSENDRQEDMHKTEEILNKVGLDEYIKMLDSNLTKEFDKDGIVCSGGQKQKLAIARALYREADIILLDELSSALDPIAEDRIQRLIDKQNKTVIMISHRLSTIRNMDKIYFIEDGTVAEAGTHEKLMEINGKYAEMYRIQAEKYEK